MKGLSLLLLLTALAFPVPGRADEVDDVLKVRAKNRDKVHRFSGEFTVVTTQPKHLKNPKTLKMRFKLDQVKIPPAERKAAHQPWRVNAEVMEPHPMKLRIDGEQASFLSHRGDWINLPLTPEVREQFANMSERFMGADPSEQRKHFAIKVLRRNNPVFGPKTKTIEFVPHGKSKMFHRREEDVDSDGLALETRTFDEQGNRSVTIKVKKHRKVHGVPFVEEMETLSESTVGEITSQTTCANLEVECLP